MLHLNELRHGNYYLFSGETEDLVSYHQVPGQVLLNDYYQYYVSLQLFSNEMLEFYTPSQIEPIPMTPELVRQCGFKNGETYPETVLFKEGLGVIWRQGRLYVLHVPTEIAYFHQLQNLYFVMTGQELELPKQQSLK